MLYAAAAILIPSILPYTVTLDRKLNGTLIRRASKLCGSGEDAMVERLSIDAGAAVDDSGQSTRELVLQWGKYNYGRAALVGIGAFCGLWASLNEAFLSGVQVGAQAIIGELLKQQALAKAGVTSAVQA